MLSRIRFDTKKHHIHTKLRVKSQSGMDVSFTAIVDTGAPFTELSDRSLIRVVYHTPQSEITTHDLQETQKYGKVRLVEAHTLGQCLDNWIVYVSRFDASWNIDALIGLDFLRRFKTTIDYGQGLIVTEPLA